MKKNKKINQEVSGTPVFGQPENAFEMINKYGTYNIQPTAESGNEFPEIAQGLPKEKREKKER